MAWPMATTSNAAMRKKTPFYVTVLVKRTTSQYASNLATSPWDTGEALTYVLAGWTSVSSTQTND